MSMLAMVSVRRGSDYDVAPGTHPIRHAERACYKVLNDAAVRAQRRQMARLIEEPNAFPFVQEGAQVF